MELIYKYWCTYCGVVKYAKRTTDFSSVDCGECNSRAFGLIQYKLIKSEV